MTIRTKLLAAAALRASGRHGRRPDHVAAGRPAAAGQRHRDTTHDAASPATGTTSPAAEQPPADRAVGDPAADRHRRQPPQQAQDTAEATADAVQADAADPGASCRPRPDDATADARRRDAAGRDPAPASAAQAQAQPPAAPAAGRRTGAPPATAADVRAGVQVRDQAGGLVGTIESVDAGGAVVSTGTVRGQDPGRQLRPQQPGPGASR